MLKLGMVDIYLDNFHTNYYPGYIAKAAKKFGHDVEVAYAWAENAAPPGRMASHEWSEKFAVEVLPSYEALLEQADGIMVMCADNCYPHEALAQKALKSGKRVFCDKTFAPTLEAARRMFALAEEYGTEVYSCSAKRYNSALLEFLKNAPFKAAYCATMGPGDMVNYSVHQFEMIQAVMGMGASRCMGHAQGGVRQLFYEYAAGRSASFIQAPGAAFTISVSDAQQTTQGLDVRDYEYDDFGDALCGFFLGGGLPVKPQDTLEIMAMQQAGRAALDNPGVWVAVERP